MSTPAWIPRRSLIVGVTGHRPDRLAAHDMTALAGAIATVFAAIETAVQTGPASIRLVSALAEGADSIAVDAASSRGWALDVVLPFTRADYAADFATGAVRDAHLARLARAGAVFELPGDRRLENGEQIAYERAGRVVLAQCDVLVAVWDNGPTRGRGGAAQIVAEAVLQAIPVIQIDPARAGAPQLLWDGPEELDLGQQSVETVARASLDHLPHALGELLDPPDSADDRTALARFEEGKPRTWSPRFAYPLLLAVMGVSRPRRAPPLNRAAVSPHDIPAHHDAASDIAFAGRLGGLLDTRFAHADEMASRFAQTYRSGYVANFLLAAFAVVLSLLGLVAPAAAKPVLIALEFGAIAIILVITRLGNRAGWHRRWLDSRTLAERLRCLAISARIGDLALPGAGGGIPPWVAWYTRGTARELGLPNTPVDDAYLARVQREVIAMIDAQIDYLSTDAHRMHQLEHRLHRLGTGLFAATAATCLAVLLFKTMSPWVSGADQLDRWFLIGATILSAALPAIGAALYGIRMQGEFAGIAARNDALVAHLISLKKVINDDSLSFDTLQRRIRRMTALLTGDLESWRQTYYAHPLTLPG